MWRLWIHQHRSSQKLRYFEIPHRQEGKRLYYFFRAHAWHYIWTTFLIFLAIRQFNVSKFSKTCLKYVFFSTNDSVFALNKLLHLCHFEKNELKHSLILKNFIRKRNYYNCLYIPVWPNKTVSITCYLSSRSQNYFLNIHNSDRTSRKHDLSSKLLVPAIFLRNELLY